MGFLESVGRFRTMHGTPGDFIIWENTHIERTMKMRCGVLPHNKLVHDIHVALRLTGQIVFGLRGNARRTHLGTPVMEDKSGKKNCAKIINISKTSNTRNLSSFRVLDVFEMYSIKMKYIYCNEHCALRVR